MAFTFAHGLILILSAASMLTVSMANRGWYNGSNYTFSWSWGHKNGSHNSNNTNDDDGTNKIIVGGSDNWHFGFNYSVWAFQNAPFYVNDVLGKFTPPYNFKYIQQFESLDTNFVWVYFLF